MSNAKIQQALGNLFDKQRIVFWYDTRREFRADFESLALPGVEKIWGITPQAARALKEQHLVFQENQRGVDFEMLFGPYLIGAKRIIVTDPYLRMFHQQRNLMELLETISRNSMPEDEVAVHVVTVEDEFSGDRQTEYFEKMASAMQGVQRHVRQVAVNITCAECPFARLPHPEQTCKRCLTAP